MVFATGGRASILVMDGAPTDADFDLPVDGLVVFDRGGNLVWFRLGGVWKSVALP
ncbi:MAG: hypothetical protein V3W28_06255 [Thermoplasmata archaeon]